MTILLTIILAVLLGCAGFGYLVYDCINRSGGKW